MIMLAMELKSQFSVDEKVSQSGSNFFYEQLHVTSVTLRYGATRQAYDIEITDAQMNSACK